MVKSEAGVILLADLLLWMAFLSLVLAVAVYAGRQPLVQGQLDRAAKAAAAEAASHRTREAAVRGAREAARANLEQDGIACRQLEVAVDASDWSPGGLIRTEVSCDVDVADLVQLGLGLPVGVPMSSWFVVAIDTHKALE